MMKLPHRRRFLHLAAGAATLPAVSRMARADTYPSRPVRIIVGYPPGGTTDIGARLTGQWLSERLGQQFVTENRPGGGGTIGTEAVVRALPDGYTLLVVATTHAINATLYDKLSFNFIRDITPVAGIVHAPFVMVVNPSSPAKTVGQFIVYAKANPGKINMGASGPGSNSHLYGELLKSMTGMDMVAAQYRGVAQALPDLLSGRLDVIFLPVATAVEQPGTSSSTVGIKPSQTTGVACRPFAPNAG